MKKTGWHRSVGGSPLAVAKFVSGGFEPAEIAASVKGHSRSLSAGPFAALYPRLRMVKTKLFPATNRSFRLATVRDPVLEVVAAVETYENSRGFSLRVVRAGRLRECPG